MAHLRVSGFCDGGWRGFGRTRRGARDLYNRSELWAVEMRWGNGFLNDSANKDVATFTGTVGGQAGTAVTVDTTGNIDTGSGFATIKPTKGATLTI